MMGGQEEIDRVAEKANGTDEERKPILARVW